MVTIRKEPFAWVHAVVDAAVNLIAFDDATAVLLPKAAVSIALMALADRKNKAKLYRWLTTSKHNTRYTLNMEDKKQLTQTGTSSV